MVECMLSKCKVLNSNLVLKRKKTNPVKYRARSDSEHRESGIREPHCGYSLSL
jgi:hypothetical protein